MNNTFTNNLDTYTVTNPPTFINPHSEVFGDIPSTLELFRERSENISKKEEPIRSKLLDQMTDEDLRSIVDFDDGLMETKSDELMCDVYDELRNHYRIHSIHTFINECRDRLYELELHSIKDFIDSRTDEELIEIYDQRENIFYLTNVREEIEDHHQQMTEEFGISNWGRFSQMCEDRIPQLHQRFFDTDLSKGGVQ